MTSIMKIGRRNFKIWGRRGFVDNSNSVSHTEIWSQGGGGYVHPQHGGFVRAPNIRAQVHHIQNVRLTFADNTKATVPIAGEMSFFPDDDVSVFYACGPDETSGDLVGVINHTEQRFWTYTSALQYRSSAKMKLLLLIVLGLIVWTVVLPGKVHVDPSAVFMVIIAAIVMRCVGYRRFKGEALETITDHLQSAMRSGVQLREKTRSVA